MATFKSLAQDTSFSVYADVQNVMAREKFLVQIVDLVVWINVRHAMGVVLFWRSMLPL